jgi:hypothetical protein
MPANPAIPAHAAIPQASLQGHQAIGVMHQTVSSTNGNQAIGNHMFTHIGPIHHVFTQGQALNSTSGQSSSYPTSSSGGGLQHHHHGIF